MQTKVTSETTAIKTEQQDFSLPQRHFIEYLMGVIDKPLQKHGEKQRKLEP
jgi:hypothetical protein